MKANGFFDDILEALIDGAEQFGDFFYPGVSTGARYARDLKRKIWPKESKSAGGAPAAAARAIEKKIEKKEEGSGFMTGPPPSRKRRYFHQKKNVAGKMHVVGCELLKIMPDHKAFTVGDIVYQTKINPVTMDLPKMKRTVRGYERVSVENLTFHLDSACGTTRSGQLAVLIDKDPKDKWASGGEFVARNALSHSTCKLHTLYQNTSISVGGSGVLWVDPDGDDDVVRFDTFGTLLIICTQPIESGDPLGLLSVSYDLVVAQPAENNDVAVGSFWHMTAYGNALVPFESMTVSTMSSLPAIVTDPQNCKVTVNAPGAFMISQFILPSSSTWANTSTWTLSVGSEAEVFANYGCTSVPSGTHDTSDVPFITFSCLVYAESTWSLNAARAISAGEWKTNEGLTLWITALDSLPWATLASAARVNRLNATAARLQLEKERFETQKGERPLTVPASMSSTSSSTTSSSHSLTAAPTMTRPPRVDDLASLSETGVVPEEYVVVRSSRFASAVLNQPAQIPKLASAVPGCKEEKCKP